MIIQNYTIWQHEDALFQPLKRGWKEQIEYKFCFDWFYYAKDAVPFNRTNLSLLHSRSNHEICAIDGNKIARIMRKRSYKKDEQGSKFVRIKNLWSLFNRSLRLHSAITSTPEAMGSISHLRSTEMTHEKVPRPFIIKVAHRPQTAMPYLPTKRGPAPPAPASSLSSLIFWLQWVSSGRGLEYCSAFRDKRSALHYRRCCWREEASRNHNDNNS